MSGNGRPVAASGTWNLARWASLSGRRAPLILDLAFWGAYAGTLLVSVHFIVTGPPSSGTVLTEVLGVAYTVALLPTGVLWPLLSWTPGAPGARPKALSVLFYLSTTTLLIGSGGPLLQIMVAAALGNLVVVIGVRTALSCTALVAASAVAVFSFTPARLVTGLLEASIVFFLGVLSVVAFSALLAAQRRARETDQVLAELEDTNTELRRYADRVKELTVAEERARMAREMHDSIGHYLTVLNIGLSNAERFRSARPEAAWQEVADAQHLAQEALADTRRWVRALRPLQMEGKAGPEAVRTLAEAFSGGGADGARVRFTCDGDWPELGEETELVCYRVVQEGLTNAVRHSGAGTIEVVLECGADGVAVSVLDDGCGAGSGEPSLAGGFGLDGLRERVRSVDGALETGPRDGGGFALRASLPARRPAEAAA